MGFTEESYKEDWCMSRGNLNTGLVEGTQASLVTV